MLVPFILALLSTMPGGMDLGIADARLNDLCFVDARHGWAVGDRGVIWTTDDGGQRWQQQTSGVTCSLAAVSFCDEQTGWAAGGFAHPYTHTSSGVLLSTRDGGQTWTANSTVVLPALRRLGFFDQQHGWALGCASAMYPSGLFATDDGGQRWRPLPGNTGPGWLAASFLDPRTGALAGRNESLAVVRRREIETARSDSFGLQSFVQMRLMRPAHGWLVGDAGAVQMTTDLGTTWQNPPGQLPPTARQFDFAALAVRGPKCWIAGTPGTRVFHSSDAGQSWNSFATGSTVPLRALWFADDQHGWAAGELGTILATSDGGQTWQQQRSGGQQAALLGIFAEPDDVPLELIARFGGNEGYLTIVDAIGRRDVEIPSRGNVPPADRLHEAVVRVGGCGADVARQFPLRQPGLQLSSQQITEAWDRVNNGHGLQELQAHIVRQIRLWRPEVLITSDAPTRAGHFSDQYVDDALTTLVHEAVLQAVARAADANTFPAQITDAGLAPWSVKKVYGAMRPGERGGSDLVTTQFAPRLGRSLADAAAEPRGLLDDRFSLAPPMLGFRLLLNSAPQEQDRRDFFGGITLAPGGPARRESPQMAGEGLDLRQHVSQKRRHVQAILDKAERSTGAAGQWLAQIDELTRDLDDESRGQILYQLADRYYRTGQWPLAAETFQVLTERYPQHPLTPHAMLWLIQYYASSETAWRVEHGEGQKRFERAAALGQQIERSRPEWFAEPAVCFPLAAAYRGLGQAKQTERLYQVQAHGSDRDAWSSCAQAELRTADSKERPTKPILICVKTDTPPHLDGELDEPLWQKAKQAVLQSAQHDDGDWPCAVMLAYDAEFLYLAAHCRDVSNANSAPPAADSPAPRPRDGDISGHDRIEVFLDVDRDFVVFDRLAIDDRGWTNDSCWNDSTWDPKWFVAAKRADGGWTVEAAIPLVALVGRPPQPRDTWAIGIQRVVPSVGFQSWSTPAAISVLPDGFGYLVFE